LWLSGIVLVGVGLNALFGWWWADPGAAMVLSVFLLREARESWEGEELEGESSEDER
jgi:divalent metal cation (Fe/Co/Zn/Cd) transporter